MDPQIGQAGLVWFVVFLFMNWRSCVVMLLATFCGTVTGLLAAYLLLALLNTPADSAHIDSAGTARIVVECFCSGIPLIVWLHLVYRAIYPRQFFVKPGGKQFVDEKVVSALPPFIWTFFLT